MASNGDSSAPAYAIPPTTFLCVEHPFGIENLDKCLESLGGDSEISKVEVYVLSLLNFPFYSLNYSFSIRKRM
jgi:hypothetical protein